MFIGSVAPSLDGCQPAAVSLDGLRLAVRAEQLNSSGVHELNKLGCRAIYRLLSCGMNAEDTAAGFHALAHTLRLGTIRLLIEAGDSGLAAGIISNRLGIAKNTLSPHLVVLTRAGLTSSQRFGRSIVYRLDGQRLRQLWEAFPTPMALKSDPPDRG